MITIGLTGSIGMGKSTVAAMFADLGAKTWCADDAVHRLYAAGSEGARRVGEAFPGVVGDEGVDRAALAGIVLSDPKELERLEGIIHPLVGEDRKAFIEEAQRDGAQSIVLDIPLLFENGSETFFDAVVVVSAPLEVQRERVLARPGMSEQKFEAILAEQMPDEEKRAKADFIISTNQSIEETRRAVEACYRQILETASS